MYELLAGRALVPTLATGERERAAVCACVIPSVWLLSELSASKGKVEEPSPTFDIHASSDDHSLVPELTV